MATFAFSFVASWAGNQSDVTYHQHNTVFYEPCQCRIQRFPFMQHGSFCVDTRPWWAWDLSMPKYPPRWSRECQFHCNMWAIVYVGKQFCVVDQSWEILSSPHGETFTSGLKKQKKGSETCLKNNYLALWVNGKTFAWQLFLSSVQLLMFQCIVTVMWRLQMGFLCRVMFPLMDSPECTLIGLSSMNRVCFQCVGLRRNSSQNGRYFIFRVDFKTKFICLFSSSSF